MVKPPPLLERCDPSCLPPHRIGGLGPLHSSYVRPADQLRARGMTPFPLQVTGLSLAVLSVLMFPLDVGNRGACSEDIVLSACKFALPMKELWMTVYMLMAILVLIIIPFTLFYYEADSD